MNDPRDYNDYTAPIWYWRWTSFVASSWRREIAYWLSLLVVGFVVGFILRGLA